MSQPISGQSKPSLITGRLGQILTHQCSLQSEHIGLFSYIIFQPCQPDNAPETRYPEEISTTRFNQTIIVILSFMRALDLDPTTNITRRLPENLLHIGQIPPVQMMKDCTSSGRESMPSSLISVWLKRRIQDMCPHIRRH